MTHNSLPFHISCITMIRVAELSEVGMYTQALDAHSAETAVQLDEGALEQRFLGTR